MLCSLPWRIGSGACWFLPCPHGLPRFPGGSASASSLSRPPQASRALRPAGLPNRPRRPLSRGSSPVSCPTKPLVSYRSNRQLSGWNPPPLVIRAVGAHWEMRAEVRAAGSRAFAVSAAWVCHNSACTSCLTRTSTDHCVRSSSCGGGPSVRSRDRPASVGVAQSSGRWP